MATNRDTFQADGLSDTVKLSFAPISVNNILVTIGGHIQDVNKYQIEPDGCTIRFAAIPPAGTQILVASFGLGAADSALLPISQTVIATTAGALLYQVPADRFVLVAGFSMTNDTLLVNGVAEVIEIDAWIVRATVRHNVLTNGTIVAPRGKIEIVRDNKITLNANDQLFVSSSVDGASTAFLSGLGYAL
ncbi:MAG: hypothetical protein MJH10_09290 [Epibacterium sp.]|nr:hypothetical protein [Epibacterium sp.]NQX73729.1 hypothetical protein [Epibacterium sp.]